MRTRSSDNWETKSGVFDALNLSYLTFTGDYPVLSSTFDIQNFTVVQCNDYKKMGAASLVSTFVDDYMLERFWRRPMQYVSIFKNAKYVMSPDFSLLIGMPRPVQEWSVYKNRLVGYIWQTEGINVIPTVSWSDSKSYSFCFNGIAPGSVVAVSNVGCVKDEHKRYFDEGFNEMIKVLSPKSIIFQCNKKNRQYYNDKNIIFIDSFWDCKRKQMIKE